MIRTLKLLAFFAVAAIGVQTNVVFAQTSVKAEGGDINAVIDRINRMEKSLGDAMRENFKKVGTDMDSVKKDIDALQGKNLALKIGVENGERRQEAFETELRILNGKIAQLEQALAKLQSNGSYVAKSAPVPTSGRLMLVNVYTEDMVFVINQRTYTVRANTTQPVDTVPTGNLTYEVFSPTWGRRANSTTTLGAGETLTITAR